MKNKMQDKRFMELVNLYVDHELNDAEAAELQSMLDANPERQRVLKFYQKMQRACEVLVNQARQGAPNTAGFRRMINAVDRGLERPRLWLASLLLTSGGATAAACLALVLFGLGGAAVSYQSTTEPLASFTATQQVALVDAEANVGADSANAGLNWVAQDFAPQVARIESNSAATHVEEKGLTLEAAQLKQMALAAWARAGVHTDGEEMTTEMSALQIQR